jgi:hypothetical protein
MTNGANILAEALEALKLDDRETIETPLLHTNSISIDAALD